MRMLKYSHCIVAPIVRMTANITLNDSYSQHFLYNKFVFFIAGNSFDDQAAVFFADAIMVTMSSDHVQSLLPSLCSM